jgi:hypothetical protein
MGIPQNACAAVEWRKALRRFQIAWVSGSSTSRLAARAAELAEVAKHVPEVARPTLQRMGSSMALETGGAAAGIGLALALALAPNSRRGGEFARFAQQSTPFNAAAVAAGMVWHNERCQYDLTLRLFRDSPFFAPAALRRHPAIAASAIHALAGTGDWQEALKIMQCTRLAAVARQGQTEGSAWLASTLQTLPATWDVAVHIHSAAVVSLRLEPTQRLAIGNDLASRLLTAGQVTLAEKAKRRVDKTIVTDFNRGSLTRGASVEAAVGRDAASNWEVALRLTATIVGEERLGTWTFASRAALARACAASGRWELSVALLRLGEMEAQAANHSSAVAVLSVGVCAELVVTLNKHGRSTEAKRALRHLVLAGVEDEALKRALQSMLAFSTDLTVAAEWARLLAERGLAPCFHGRERLVQLYSRAGDWVAALAHVTALLDAGMTPSAGAHDHVQFALKEARASWLTSAALFTRLMAARVPVSEVAFKAVVSNCLVQGAETAAEQALLSTIRLGVGRT